MGSTAAPAISGSPAAPSSTLGAPPALNRHVAGVVGQHLGMDRWRLELIGQRRQHAAVGGAHRTIGTGIGRQSAVGMAQARPAAREGDGRIRAIEFGSPRWDASRDAAMPDRIGPHPTQHSP